MIVDWTINIGTIIQTIAVIVALISGYFAIISKLNIFQIMLSNHAEQLAKHGSKMIDYEHDLRDLVGSMQRVTAEFGMFLRMRGERRIDNKVE